MPNTASAKKRLRQNIARRARNRAAKTSLRTLTKKVRESVVAKDVEQSTAAFGQLVEKLDRAIKFAELSGNFRQGRERPCVRRSKLESRFKLLLSRRLVRGGQCMRPKDMGHGIGLKAEGAIECGQCFRRSIEGEKDLGAADLSGRIVHLCKRVRFSIGGVEVSLLAIYFS